MDVMGLRRAVMAAGMSGNALPSGYTRLSYLSNPNGAYIDTGMVLSKGCKITIIFEMAQTDTNEVSYGWRWDRSYSYSNQLYVNSNIVSNVRNKLIIIGRPASDTGSGAGTPNCFDYGVKNTLIIDTDAKTVMLNGSPVTFIYDLSDNTIFNSSGSSVYSPTIFAFNNKGTITGISNSTKIYRYKVEQNGQVLQNLIPCKNPNNVYGMYDLASKQFIGSANANAFSGE